MNSIEPAVDRIFVRKVPQTATREDVAAHFRQFGPITDVYVPTVPGVSGHKGIAFITFGSPETARLVMQSAPHTIHGAAVIVDVAAPREASGMSGGYEPGGGAFLGEDAARAAAGGSMGPPEAGGSEEGLQLDILAQAEAQLGGAWPRSMPNGASVAPGVAPGIAPTATPTAPLASPAAEKPGTPQASLMALLNGSGVVRGTPAATQPNLGLSGAGGAVPSMPAHTPIFSSKTGTTVPGRLFVTKIAPTISRLDLQVYFQQFGKLTDCYVPVNKGIAFVSFEDPTVAERLLATKEHTVKPGQTVAIEQAIDRHDGVAATFAPARSSPPGVLGVAGGFAGGAGMGMAPGAGGNLAAATAMLTGALAGNVVAATPLVAGAAPVAPVQPSGAVPRGNPVPGRLFVTSVQPDMSRYDLQMYFSQFGNLSDCYTPNNGKGIAFISYADPAAAQRVLAVREHIVKGHTLNVEQAMDRQPLGGGKGIPFRTASPQGLGSLITGGSGQTSQPSFSPMVPVPTQRFGPDASTAAKDGGFGNLRQVGAGGQLRSRPY